MIQNLVGPPATGGNFFNRVGEQAMLLDRLKTSNVLLLAPRRVGKTSLLHRIADRQAEGGFRAVYVSVSDIKTEIDFLKKLFAAVEDANGGKSVIAKGVDLLKRKLPSFTGGKVEVAKIFTMEFTRDHADSWRPIGQALVDALRESPERWVLMVDEFPLFVLNLLKAGRDRTEQFLNWFRDVRLDRHAAAVRWVLCGSIGLDAVTRRERLGGTVNDLNVMRLEAFSTNDAHALLEALAESAGAQLETTVRAHLITRVGWPIPYYLQLLFQTLMDRGCTRPTIRDVDDAYTALLQPAHKMYFDYWSQRLEEELGADDAAHAHRMLAIAAADDTGAAKAALHAVLRDHSVDDAQRRRYLIDVLESDGYLVEVDGRFRFRSPFLRDYWRARIL